MSALLKTTKDTDMELITITQQDNSMRDNGSSIFGTEKALIHSSLEKSK